MYFFFHSGCLGIDTVGALRDTGWHGRDFFTDFYQPHTLTSFDDLVAIRMNSTTVLAAARGDPTRTADLASPFVVPVSTNTNRGSFGYRRVTLNAGTSGARE